LPLSLSVCLAFSALAFLAGCSSTQVENERYIDQILAENLGGTAPAEQSAVAASRSTKPAATAKKASRRVAGKTAAKEIDAPEAPAAEDSGQRAGANADVTIQPDSILWISIDEDPSLNGRYIVNEYTAIDFGYVGLVLLNDMTAKDAEGKLKRILEDRYVRQATVTVRMAKASYDRVSVIGAVVSSGLLKIGPGSTITLNDALRRAGGLKLEAATARVKIVRGGLLSPFGPISDGDIYPLVDASGKPSIPDIALANNDLVYVYAQKSASTTVGEKRIVVLGEVARQGVIQFTDSEPCTMLYLLFKIGGLPRFAKGSAVRIVRRDKEGREREIKVDADALLSEGNPKNDVVLEDGDRVIVPVKKLSFL
jgi:polysaccharide export outer membrane protein